jgi:hypothetical protein
MNRQLICIVSYICLLILGIVTCTSDEFQKETPPLPPPDPSPEQVEIMTKSVVDLSNPEDSVAQVRWIVLTTGGVVLVNQHIDADSIRKLTVDHKATITFKALLPGGYADFFMIANELPVWNLGNYDKDDVLSSETLKALMTSYTSFLPTNPSLLVNNANLVPMVGIYEHLYAASGRIYNKDTDTDVDVGKVERLYSKVTFNITALLSKQNNDKDPIDIVNIALKNMPAYSYLAPYLYLGTSVLNGATVLPTSANYKNTYDPGIAAEADSCFRGVFSFYIPEYLLTDTSKYTYASVLVKLRNDATAQKEYRIVIGDGIAKYNQTTKNNAWLLDHQGDRSVVDLRIGRNIHYHFDAKIINFSLRGEQQVEIRPIIEPWNVTNVDSVFIRDYTLTVSQDMFELKSGSSFTGKVTVTTDHPGGWTSSVKAGTGATTIPNTGIDWLEFLYSGTTLAIPDTIHVKAGTLTKKILITNTITN